MRLNVLSVRFRPANLLPTAALAVATMVAGLFVSSVGGITVGSVAMAQDSLPLGRESGSDAAIADSNDPVVVVSIASMNKLIQDINYITATAGQPQAGGMFAMMAGGFAAGLDMSRPIGIVVPIVDGAPEPIGMLPTMDVEMMLKRLEAQTGPVDKLDDGTLVVAAGPSLVYIRQVGSWAIIARQKELLDAAPTDPMAALEGLGDKFTVSARVNVGQIPEDAREALIAQLRQGFEQAMAQQQAGNPEAAEATNEQALEQLEQLIRDLNQFMLGWNIDPTKKVVTLQTQLTAQDGSETAKMYAGQKVIPSNFASVINDDHSMFYHAASSISPLMIDQSRASFDNARTMLQNTITSSNDLGDDDKQQVLELSNAVMDLFMQTIEEGKFDIGVESMADDGQIDIAAGMFVSDGNAAEELVKDLAKKLQNVGDAPTFEFDLGDYKGVTLHSVIIDIPADQDELRQTFGDQAIIKIGTAPKNVYLALGKDSEKTLKAFIDKGTPNDVPEDRPLGQMQIQFLPFLRFAQSLNANDVVAAMIDTLSQNTDTGYIAIEQNVIKNGQFGFVEIGEGMLKAAGAAFREFQAERMQQMQRGNGQF